MFVVVLPHFGSPPPANYHLWYKKQNLSFSSILQEIKREEETTTEAAKLTPEAKVV